MIRLCLWSCFWSVLAAVAAVFAPPVFSELLAWLSGAAFTAAVWAFSLATRDAKVAEVDAREWP